MTIWRLENESENVVEVYPSPNGFNWRWRARVHLSDRQVAFGVGMITEISAKSEAERWLCEQNIKFGEWYENIEITLERK